LKLDSTEKVKQSEFTSSSRVEYNKSHLVLAFIWIYLGFNHMVYIYVRGNWNGVILWMKCQQKQSSQVTAGLWHSKDPSLLKRPEALSRGWNCAALNGSGDVSIHVNNSQCNINKQIFYKILKTQCLLNNIDYVGFIFTRIPKQYITVDVIFNLIKIIWFRKTRFLSQISIRHLGKRRIFFVYSSVYRTPIPPIPETWQSDLEV
jgi:hypothetical protein